jgi:quinol monooxygenase YgiN
MQNLVFVRFFPKEGAFDQVKAILETMVVNSRTEPGCLIYDLYEAKTPEGTGGILCLAERYKDDDALLAHRATDYYKEYRATIMDLLDAPIEVNILAPIDAM